MYTNLYSNKEIVAHYLLAKTTTMNIMWHNHWHRTIELAFCSVLWHLSSVQKIHGSNPVNAIPWHLQKLCLKKKRERDSSLLQKTYLNCYNIQLLVKNKIKLRKLINIFSLINFVKSEAYFNKRHELNMIKN